MTVWDGLKPKYITCSCLCPWLSVGSTVVRVRVRVSCAVLCLSALSHFALARFQVFEVRM